ncbi:MAG: hypothetical protein N2423_10755, partial [Novosphingobium sp.]|nr:hypothetical protein [Novosphingobium sp.]
DALRNSPTIYQEIIAGEEHARALVFGNTVHAVRLKSPHFDWRGRKELVVESTRLPRLVEQRLVALLQGLGLSMAVADFKYAGDEPIFLEINPQGQFLFMQMLAGQDWLDEFAAFLACR